MLKLLKTLFLLFLYSSLFQTSYLFSQNLGLDWVATAGSNLGDEANAIAVGDEGSVYFTGSFTGTVDFDPDTGVTNLSGPNNSFYISKLDSSGKLDWAFSTGREGRGFDLAVDKQSNVYVAGYFKGFQDFDPGSNVAQLPGGTSITGFVAKYDANGNYIWAKMIGSSFNVSSVYSITLDSLNNVYLTGYFRGNTDFDPDTSVFNVQSEGGSDAFILKLDSLGNFKWVNQIGGDRRDEGYDLILSDSNIYSIGAFQDSAEVFHNSGNHKISSNGDIDGFISKYDLSGNLIWIKTFGGNSYDFPRSITTDRSGDIILNGTFRGVVDFDPGSAVFNLDSGYIFTLKLDNGGNFIWANRIQSNFATTTTFGVATDSADNIYNIGGFTGIADFDPGVGVYPLQSQLDNFFLQKLNSNGQLIYAIKQHRTYLYSETRNAIVVDDFDDIHMAGGFYDTADFDPDTSMEIRIASSQNWPDIFVQKIKQNNITTSLKSQYGIDEHSEIQLYPNPNNGNFTLKFSNEEIQRTVYIYNNLGVLLIKRVLNTNEERLNLDLKNGVYFIRSIGSSKVNAVRLVIHN